MFKLYYASAIDTCVKEAFEQIEIFKKILSKYDIEVYGAGFKDSPIISPDSSEEYKGVVSAYDLRKIRECDILLVVTDLKTFCPGTMMELEYSRNLGLYTIVLCLGNGFCKNIFIKTYANKIIYSKDELRQILKNVCGEK